MGRRRGREHSGIRSRTAASTSPAAAVRPSYTVIDLVDPSGDQTSYWQSINNAGQVSVYTWLSILLDGLAGGLVDIWDLGAPGTSSLVT